MSRVVHGGAAATVFSTVAEIHTHLLAKVQRGTAGLIGVEQELFVVTAHGQPPLFAQIEAVLRQMADALPTAKLLHEGEFVIGLSCPQTGDVCLEPGGQVELSCLPCPDVEAMMVRQTRLFAVLTAAAQCMGLFVQGAGHLPSFLDAPLVPRSRFAAYAEYCHAAHGAEKAQALLATMKSCSGLQVNLDPMGRDFHKVYRAVMAVELAGSFNDLSQRQERFAKTYAPLFPRQVTPLFNAVAARDNRALLGMIVERLLSLNVPFVPDSETAEGFLPSAAVYGVVPTVGELLAAGTLTSTLLDNALSLQMTMPNLRRHGVLETRNPDTPADLAGVASIAQRYHRAAYSVPVRRRLMGVLSRCDSALLAQAYDARFDLSREQLMKIRIGKDMTVAKFIDGVERAVNYKKQIKSISC